MMKIAGSGSGSENLSSVADPDWNPEPSPTALNSVACLLLMCLFYSAHLENISATMKKIDDPFCAFSAMHNSFPIFSLDAYFHSMPSPMPIFIACLILLCFFPFCAFSCTTYCHYLNAIIIYANVHFPFPAQGPDYWFDFFSSKWPKRCGSTSHQREPYPHPHPPPPPPTLLNNLAVCGMQGFGSVFIFYGSGSGSGSSGSG
jgi:hypothetical protein